MNRAIEEQLRKVTNADLSNYDKDNHKYFIPKKIGISLKEGNCYLIKLNDILLHPNSSLDTIMNVWNKGNIPQCKWYKVEVDKILSKLIRVNCIEFNYSTQTDGTKMWSGWLPVQEIEIIEEL